MRRSRRLAVLALLFALIIIFNFVPIAIGPITLGIMILPVLVAALTEDFKTTMICSLFLGLTNLVSWFTTKAALPLAPIFQNPLVCIVPRLLIGVVTYWVYHGLLKATDVLYKSREAKAKSVVDDTEDEAPAEGAAVTPDISAKTQVEVIETAADEKKARRLVSGGRVLYSQLSALAACVLGVVTNTLFVGIMTVLLFNGQTVGGTAISPPYILGLFALNFIVEVIAFPLVTPPIAYALNKIKR